MCVYVCICVYVYICININLKMDIINLRENGGDTGEVGGREGGVEMV